MYGKCLGKYGIKGTWQQLQLRSDSQKKGQSSHEEVKTTPATPEDTKCALLSRAIDAELIQAVANHLPAPGTEQQR